MSGHEHAVLLGAAGVLAPQLSNLLPGVSLRPDVPTGFSDIVVAIDWLSHVPANVVHAVDDDPPRVVHVDPHPGQHYPGLDLDYPAPPPPPPRGLPRPWPPWAAP